MIERILDNYYKKKLFEIIKEDFMIFNIDIRFKSKNHFTNIQIKKKEYDDKKYLSIASIYDKNIFIRLIDYKGFEKYLKDLILNYLKS